MGMRTPLAGSTVIRSPCRASAPIGSLVNEESIRAP